MGGALIVADDNQSGKRFADFFRGKGLASTVWPSAALESTRVAQLQPELILIASSSAGAQLVQQFKLDPRTNLIPLLLVEGRAAPERPRPGYYFSADAV